jgi:hypothetical protein
MAGRFSADFIINIAECSSRQGQVVEWMGVCVEADADKPIELTFTKRNQMGTSAAH